MPRADWLAAKRDYLADSSLSYEDIAVRYKVNVKTVKRHGIRDRWGEERKKVHDAVLDNVSKKVVDELSTINERHTKSYKEMQDMVLLQLENVHSIIKEQNRTLLAEAEAADDPPSEDKQRKKLSKKELFSSQQIKFLAEALKVALDGERITLGLPTTVIKNEQDIKTTSEFINYTSEDLERMFTTVDAAVSTPQSPTD